MLNKFMKRFTKVAALVLVVVLVLGVMPPGVVLADEQDGELSPVPITAQLTTSTVTFYGETDLTMMGSATAQNVIITYSPLRGVERPFSSVERFGIPRMVFATNPEHVETWNPLAQVLTYNEYLLYCSKYGRLSSGRVAGNINFDALRFPREGVFVIMAGHRSFLPGPEIVPHNGADIVINVQRASVFLQILGGENNQGNSVVIEYAPTIPQLPSFSRSTLGETTATYTNTTLGSYDNPVLYPDAINIGRPIWDTHGAIDTISWIIRGVDNTVERDGVSEEVNISGLAPGLYRIYASVTELPLVSRVLVGGFTHLVGEIPFPHGGTALTTTAIGYFRIGDPPDEPTPPPATFTIYKDLLLPPGTDMPTDPFHFDFTATFLPDEFWPPVSNSPTNVQLAPLPIRIPFTYCMYDDYATSVSVGGVTYSSITQSTTIDLNAVNWPRPGIYTFRIAETPNSSGLHSTDGIAMDYDPTLFYLVVHVIFPDGDFSRPLEVSFFGISHSRVPHPDYPNCPGIRDALGNFTCECTPGIDYSAVENKPRNVTFTNYLRRPPANTYFEVEKRLAGDMANTDAEYTITVYLYEDYARTTLLTLATGAGHPDAIYAYVYGYQRNATTGFVMPSEPKERVSRTRVTGLPHVANLRHGDTIRFSNVPVGTGFRVIEAYIPGYIQTASVVTGGGTATNVANPAMGVNLVASGTISALPQGTPPPAGGVFNYVTVTNAHDDTPPTGVFMQNVPFGLMVALGAGALALTATVAIAYKKKK